MTLAEITKEFNDMVEIKNKCGENLPELSITDCKSVEDYYDEETEVSYEACSFPHYYTDKNGVEFDLGFDDYGDHGWWNLYEHTSSNLIKCNSNVQIVIEAMLNYEEE